MTRNDLQLCRCDTLDWYFYSSRTASNRPVLGPGLVLVKKSTENVYNTKTVVDWTDSSFFKLCFLVSRS